MINASHDCSIQIEILDHSESKSDDEICIIFGGCFVKSLILTIYGGSQVKLRELECHDLIIIGQSSSVDAKIILDDDCLIVNRLEVCCNDQGENQASTIGHCLVENYMDITLCEVMIGERGLVENHANLQVLNQLKGKGILRNFGMIYFGLFVEIELNCLESVGMIKFPQLESFIKEIKKLDCETEDFTQAIPRGFNFLNRIYLLKGLIGKNTRTRKPQILTDLIVKYLKENPVENPTDLSDKVNEYLLRHGIEYVCTWVSTAPPNIRNSPSTQGEVIEKLEPWKTVQIKSISCGGGEVEFWACIGEDAYVSTDFLKIKPKFNHPMYPNMNGTDLLSIYGPNEPFLNENLNSQGNQEVIVVNTPLLDENLQQIGEKLAGDLVTSFGFVEINGKSLVKISADEEHYIDSDCLSSEMDKNLLNKNVRAFLELIAFCEGTFTYGYNRIVNGTPTTDPFQTCYSHGIVNITSNLNTHPFILVSLNATLKSTASGKYQYLNRTWHALSQQVHGNLFTPYGQDRGAIALLMKRESLQTIKQGNIELALNLCNKEWASFPNSPYGQPTKKMEICLQKYSEFLSRLQ